jgi:hypothetical protein
MMLAKHHYALELARAGNKVYFLNPPDNRYWTFKNFSKRIRIRISSENPNLSIIDQELYFPYIFKYHARKLYNILIKKQIRDILRMIDRPVDIVWSFDLGNLFPIKYFPNKFYKIFHPVDEPGDQQAIDAAAGATILFSVTKEIIDKYAFYHIPSFFINHGLADEFISEPQIPFLKGNMINVGFSGNLLRQDLDRKTLLQIVEENPDLIFNFYGSYVVSESNIGAGTDEETRIFIDKLQTYKNTVLHGVLKTSELAKQLNLMDVFLICYDIEKDQSKGTNYHKVMEYLSTGKVIVSNNITTYSDQPVLVCMSEERNFNRLLPALFKNTVLNLGEMNSPESARERISFAQKNSYKKQLIEIGQFIDGITTTFNNN